ncbi:MAG TPA: 30S ribosomal protein S17 [Candidatus Jacksonbacteria bacterium]|nr:MAG: hypothetical protein UV19_C0001G0020 [Parcubacteria group bacterium GW2011_GWA2_42_28]KKT56215.1 MAG: hypothetical protein UW45_C0001G0019 [Parcubacteria group bacterium GW2011_GWC2_44_22]HBH46518.1 30S ribosomal protein S17 [Candidatus Jacksonbacteria bacterium]HCC50282.1 30S ribosomal protein S17 [Candidatus Jacksonbacteria bacterium]HCE49701.1 30S ribosomal protein S17 [Candidatus Jacksonbacteria bacterium]
MKKQTYCRQLKGVVTSNKMNKTVVIEVSRVKKHSKYHKIFAVSAKYKAHDETNSCRIGEQVMIEACRPMSKDKKWSVVKKVKAVS